MDNVIAAFWPVFLNSHTSSFTFSKRPAPASRPEAVHPWELPLYTYTLSLSILLLYWNTVSYAKGMI